MRASSAVAGLVAVLAGAGCVLGLDGLASTTTGGGSGGAGGAPCSTHIDDDPLNCGACGQNCMGSKCIGGQCQPMLVASAQKVSSPWGLALVDGTLLWTVGDGKDVRKVDPTSGASPVDLGASQGGASAIAADGDGVFYATQHGIVRCSAGSVCEQAIYASGDGANVRSIALDAANVYWTEAATGMSDGRLVRCNRSANDCASSAVTMAQGLMLPEQVVVAGAWAYWAERGADGAPDGRVARLPASADASQAPSVLMSSRDAYWGVLVTATHVYATVWGTPDAIVSCALPCDGGAPAVLARSGATEVAHPLAMGLDQSDLYWTNGGGSTLSMCDVTACKPGDTASDRPQPLALALDATWLYWTDALGNVWRVVY